MRLIDLHTDWPLQYAGESTTFDPAFYAGIADRVGQASGYLQATSAAVVACFRRAEEWKARADPWAALGSLIAGIEAEFSGRVLRDPADLIAWRADDQALAWALIGIEGLDYLVRTADDLDRLPGLIRRGARLIQPTYGPESLLAGSSSDGDDRGLLGLGRRLLEVLARLADPDRGPRPIVDLAHLNPRAAGEVLAWFESDPEHPRRLIPAYSHGGLRREGFLHPRALSPENLRRLRALGGVVGLGVTPPFLDDPEQLRRAIEAAAAVPFLGRPGYEGIALGTDFLGVASTLPGLGDAEEVIDWVARTFPPDVAPLLLFENGRQLFERAIGGLHHDPARPAS